METPDQQPPGSAVDAAQAETTPRPSPPPLKDSSDIGTPTVHPRRHWLRWFMGLGLALLLGAVAVPWVIARTSLRDRLIRVAVGDPNIRVTSQQASFGWWSPLSISQLQLERTDGSLLVRLERFGTDRSWFQILLGLPELGTVVLDGPSVEVVGTTPMQVAADRDPAAVDRRPKVKPRLVANVTDASFRLRPSVGAKPIVAIENVDVHLRITEHGEGRLLTIEPTALLDTQELTPELCDQGLKLIAPILAETTALQGAVSFHLRECSVPLELPPEQIQQEMKIAGQLQLHHVSAGMKNKILLSVTEKLSALLGVAIPTRVRIAEDTAVDFHVRDGRVYHEGLAFVFPEVSPDFEFQSAGSVGLDETIDIRFRAPLPLTMLHDGPLMQRLSEHPLELHVTGTLGDPKIGLPPETDWAGGLLAILQGMTSAESEAIDNGEESVTAPLADSILDAVGAMLEATAEQRNTGEQTETPLLDRLLELRQRRMDSQPAASDADSQDRPGIRLPLLRRRPREL